MTGEVIELLGSMHQVLGDGWFILLTGGLCVVLCLWAIPLTTDWMVDSGAGLAGKHLGPQQRTLVINASTNNPELFSMIVSLLLLRLGGIANPLGSNFSNIYLMFLVAPVVVLVRWQLAGNREGRRALGRLLREERRLVAWHFSTAILLFLAASAAYFLLTGQDPFRLMPTTVARPGAGSLWGAAAICLAAIAFFFWRERRFRRGRPELFEDITDESHVASWTLFAVGTLGLIACCYLINTVFVSWSSIYSAQLSAVLGAAVFAALHYFVGSIVTSLPEMMVAMKNLRQLRAPDLNTALGSASYSNLSNLGIAALGSLLAAVALGLGARLEL